MAVVMRGKDGRRPGKSAPVVKGRRRPPRKRATKDVASLSEGAVAAASSGVPDHPAVMLEEGSALLAAHRWEEADLLAAELTRRFPDDQGVSEFFANVVTCEAQTLAGQPRYLDWLGHAQRRWAVVRDRFPNSAAAWIMGGYLHLLATEYDKAEALFVIAMERFPGEPDGFGLFGRVATLRNDWTEAGRRWGLARERFPQDPGIMAGEREYLIRAASAVPKEHPVPLG